MISSVLLNMISDPKHSCETELVNFTQNCFDNLETGKQTDLIIVDFSKALDKEDNNLSTYKLFILGIDLRTVSWVYSFLQNFDCKVIKKLGYLYHKSRNAFAKFYLRHPELIDKYDIGLKTLLQQGISEPAYYGDLVYKFKGIIDKIRKKAMIRNRYNQAPNLTQNTTWKSDKTQENITNKRGMRLSVPSR